MTTSNGTSPDPAQLSKLRQLYDYAGQGHVFTFYDTLSPQEQSSLLDQLANIDVERVNRIYRNAVSVSTPPVETKSLDSRLGVTNLIGRSRTPSPSPDEVIPLPDEACATILNNPQDEARWREIGLKAISENTVAVLLLAGGQGTRLGSTSPKGMYDLKLPSGRSLFDYQAKRIGKLERLAEEASGKGRGSVRIKWYVMTSGPTRQETEKYFQSMEYFGLNKENVIFFEQGTSTTSTRTAIERMIDKQVSYPHFPTTVNSSSAPHHQSLSLPTVTAVYMLPFDDPLPATRPVQSFPT
jgi:UDP-N-acetylglucosamine/UDP-N-acetylgalactosamine diphosphorylase